jgi:2-phospho-L-lactate guanylyltransferase
MSVRAVIAVRGGKDVKSRFGGALTAPERAELVSAMLADMVEALTASPGIDAVHVVTPTPELADLARAGGARVLLESQARGINAAFEAARSEIRRQAPYAIIAALPADLPLIEGAEIEVAIGKLEPGAVVLVPASADGGTGAAILRADAPFAFQFGPDSFRRHGEAAAAAGLKAIVVRAASLGLDIDRPEDLNDVTRRARGGRTVGVVERLQRLREARR